MTDVDDLRGLPRSFGRGDQSGPIPRPGLGERSSAVWQSQGGFDRALGIAGAASAVAQGYEAGQTAGAQDDIAGLFSAAAAGATVGGPVGALVAAGAYLVTNLFGISKGRKERSRIRGERTKRIIEIGSTEAIPMPFVRGRFERELALVYGAVGDNMPGWKTGTTAFRNTGGRQRIWGSMRTKYRAEGTNTTQYDANDQTQVFFGPGSAENEPYLLAQYDICAGPITELYCVLTDGRDIDRDVQLQDQVLARLGLPNTVDPAIDPAIVTSAQGQFTPDGPRGSAIPPRRTADSRFLNKSYLTFFGWAAKRDWEAWKNDGKAPLLTVIGYGPGLKLIERSSAAPYTYSEASATNFDGGRNAVLVEYWRLRDIVGIPVTQFHLPGWWKAQQQASMPTGGMGASAPASTGSVFVPGIVNGDIGGESSGETPQTFYRRIGRLPPGSPFPTTGLQANTCLGGTQSARTSRRYEFDGEIPSDITSAEQSALVLESMPGSLLFRRYDGKLSIDLIDPDTPAATQVVGTISDAQIVYWDYPTADNVVSRVNARYKDANQDLREATDSFPTPGSKLSNDLEALEGKANEIEFYYEGTVNPDAAHSHSVNYVTLSHRKVGRIIASLDHWRFEEGDKITFIDEEEGVNDIVRITRRQRVGEVMVFDIMQFRTIDGSYQPKQVEEHGLPPSADAEIPLPRALSVIQQGNDLTLRWRVPTIRNVGGYEVQIDYSDGWQEVEIKDDAGAQYATYTLPAGIREYEFRVRSRGVVRGYSDWVVSAKYKTHGDPKATIYEPLAPGEYPSPSVGEQHRLWQTTDGRLLRYYDPWETDIVGQPPIEGVSGGLLARFVNQRFRYSSASKRFILAPITTGRVRSGTLAANAFPAADDYNEGDYYEADDGRVFRKGPDPWTTTAFGQDGIFARLDNQTWWYNAGFGGNWITPFGVKAITDTRKLPDSLGGFFIERIDYRAAPHRWHIDLSATSPGISSATGANLPEGIEDRLVLAVQNGAQATWSQVNDSDDADPYEWIDDAPNADNVFTGNAQITGSKILFLDIEQRDPSNPLNPWLLVDAAETRLLPDSLNNGFVKGIEFNTKIANRDASQFTFDITDHLPGRRNRGGQNLPDVVDNDLVVGFRKSTGEQAWTLMRDAATDPADPYKWTERKADIAAFFGGTAAFDCMIVLIRASSGRDPSNYLNPWTLLRNLDTKGVAYSIFDFQPGTAPPNDPHGTALPTRRLRADGTWGETDTATAPFMQGPWSLIAPTDLPRVWFTTSRGTEDNEQKYDVPRPVLSGPVSSDPPIYPVQRWFDRVDPDRGGANRMNTVGVAPVGRGDYKIGPIANAGEARLFGWNTADVLFLNQTASIGVYLVPTFLNLRAGDYIWVLPLAGEQAPHPFRVLLRLTSQPIVIGAGATAYWRLEYEFRGWRVEDGYDLPALSIGALGENIGISFPWDVEQGVLPTRDPDPELAVRFDSVGNKAENDPATRLNPTVVTTLTGTRSYRWDVSFGTISNSSSAAGTSTSSTEQMPWWHIPESILVNQAAWISLTVTIGDKSASWVERVLVRDRGTPVRPEDLSFHNLNPTWCTVKWDVGIPAFTNAIPTGWVIEVRDGSVTGTLLQTVNAASFARMAMLGNITGPNALTPGNKYGCLVRATSRLGNSPAATGTFTLPAIDVASPTNVVPEILRLDPVISTGLGLAANIDPFNIAVGPRGGGVPSQAGLGKVIGFQNQVVGGIVQGVDQSRWDIAIGTTKGTVLGSASRRLASTTTINGQPATLLTSQFVLPVHVNEPELMLITLNATVHPGGGGPVRRGTDTYELMLLPAPFVVDIFDHEDIDEGGKLRMRASISGGTGTGTIIQYSWECSHGQFSDNINRIVNGSTTSTAARPQWFAPTDVDGNTQVRFKLVVRLGNNIAEDVNFVTVRDVDDASALRIDRITGIGENVREGDAPKYLGAVLSGSAASNTDLVFAWSIRTVDDGFPQAEPDWGGVFGATTDVPLAGLATSALRNPYWHLPTVVGNRHLRINLTVTSGDLQATASHPVTVHEFDTPILEIVGVPLTVNEGTAPIRLSTRVTSVYTGPVTLDWEATAGFFSSSATAPTASRESELAQPWWHIPENVNGDLLAFFNCTAMQETAVDSDEFIEFSADQVSCRIIDLSECAVEIHEVEEATEGEGGELLNSTVTGTATGPITYAWSCTIGTLSNSSSVAGSATTSTLERPYWHPPATLVGDRTGKLKLEIDRGGCEAEDEIDLSVLDKDITYGVSINAIEDVTEGARGFQLDYTQTGTATGAASFAWHTTHGTLSSNASQAGSSPRSLLERPYLHVPNDVTRDTEVTVTLESTRQNRTATATATFTVENDIADVVFLFDIDAVPSPLPNGYVYRLGFTERAGNTAQGEIGTTWSCVEGTLSDSPTVAGTRKVSSSAQPFYHAPTVTALTSETITLTATREGRSHTDTETFNISTEELTVRITNVPFAMSDGESSQLDLALTPETDSIDTYDWDVSNPLTLSDSESNRGSSRTAAIRRPWMHAPGGRPKLQQRHCRSRRGA